MRLEFTKWHCCENDYLIFEDVRISENQLSGFTKFICRQHSGLGADGCVFLSKNSKGDLSFRIFNKDGSEAEMSGNGARCAAAHLHRSGHNHEEPVILATKSGKKILKLIGIKDSLRWTYCSEMGKAFFLPEKIPCLIKELKIVSQHFLEIEGQEVEVNALSVGNPQCVVILDRLPKTENFRYLGSKLETHALFPNRTNVSFVQVIDRKKILIQVWERGVGATASSGTGCCGAAVTVIRLGLCDSPVEVSTTSGSQFVQWKLDSAISLTGHADLIAKGNCYWNC